MKSTITKRSIVIDGHKTSVSLEDAFWSGLKDLGGANKPFTFEMEILNQSFRMGGDHLFAYDEVTLSALLERAGFCSVTKRRYQPESFVDPCEKWRTVESLALSATKEAQLDK